MARFDVREVLWLACRRELVLAGTVAEGTIVAGMQALIWLDSQAFWALPIWSVEAIDRVSVGESMVGLVVHGLTDEDAAVCAELCLPGDAIEVSEPANAV